MLALLALLCAHAAAEESEPTLLQKTSSGAYALDGEDTLIIQEIRGTISLRSATDDTLRFEGRSLDSKRDHQEVALWRGEDGVLILGPGAGSASTGTLVDMVVPDALDVEVVLVQGRLVVSGILGDLWVEAEDSGVQARGLRGAAEFRLQGGKLIVDGVKGELDFTGVATTAQLQHLYEGATLSLKQGVVAVLSSEGDLAIESDGTELRIEKLEGEIEADSTGGSLRATGCSGAGTLYLTETPLALVGNKGDWVVRTDAPVEFDGHEGALSFSARGSNIRGSQVAGTIDLENDGATVELSQIAGRTEVRGSDLKLKVEDCKGPLTARLAASEVLIQRMQNEIVVENDFGDVRVGDTETTLTITNGGGNVMVRDHQGPLELRADGPEVRVGWTNFTKTSTVNVFNKSGDVYLDLPPTGRCQVQLEAPFGLVDPGPIQIRVADDGRAASGEVTGGRGAAPQVKKPQIKARSGGGNVYLGNSAQKN
jgi:hypothetical protein